MRTPPAEPRRAKRARPARRATRPRAARPADATPRERTDKSDATRAKLLERALQLFQQRGVDGTTMREIARAAGLSLGAAYYYFPSKEALVFAYYQDRRTQAEAGAAAATGSTRERLGAAFHASLESIRPHRRMLAAIVGRLVDPADPLSALSAQQRAVRERSIAVVGRALDGSGLPPETVPLVASALWLFQMACMLLYVHDESPRQARTHQLVDDALDLLVPMLPLLGTPIGRAVTERISAALSRAGIVIGP